MAVECQRLVSCSMAKNDRTTTIEHRKNNTTYNKRTKAAKPNPNLKLEKKTKKTQKESKINHVLSFFSVLVRFFFRFCFTLFFFVFVCFFLMFFFTFVFVFFHELFTCSKVSVIRSPEKGKARQNKRKKKRRKKTAKEDRQKKKRKETNRI